MLQKKADTRRKHASILNEGDKRDLVAHISDTSENQLATFENDRPRLLSSDQRRLQCAVIIRLSTERISVFSQVTRSVDVVASTMAWSALFTPSIVGSFIPIDVFPLNSWHADDELSHRRTHAYTHTHTGA